MDNHKKVFALRVPSTLLSMHKVCANATNSMSMKKVQSRVQPALIIAKHVALTNYKSIPACIDID